MDLDWEELKGRKSIELPEHLLKPQIFTHCRRFDVDDF